jgi:pimeloyl-ACP methyl ester carboxylesterase
VPITTGKSAGIYWRESGTGPPLLLIIGIGYTSDMWHSVEPLLAEHNRLILFDNRGVGSSDAIHPGYTIADMASDALAVLDAAGEETAHIFSLSMGGYVAQEFALQYPDRIRSLILGCTSCGGDQAIPADDEVWDVIQARRSMLPEEGVRAMIPYIYDGTTPADRIAADIEIRLRSYPRQESYDLQLAAIRNWQSCDRLGSIRSPTFILHGENDRLIPPENGRRLAELIPGAQFRMLGNASHIFTTDQPTQTARLIHEFLELL